MSLSLCSRTASSWHPSFSFILFFPLLCSFLLLYTTLHPCTYPPFPRSKSDQIDFFARTIKLGRYRSTGILFLSFIFGIRSSPVPTTLQLGGGCNGIPRGYLQLEALEEPQLTYPIHLHPPQFPVCLSSSSHSVLFFKKTVCTPAIKSGNPVPTRGSNTSLVTSAAAPTTPTSQRQKDLQTSAMHHPISRS